MIIVELLTLFSLFRPDNGQMGGIYCDEIAVEILDYQRETGAFSEKELEKLIGNCEIWEEGYEERVESGEEREINN